jgi:hypothetical protein
MSVPGFNRPVDGAGGLKIPDKLKFVANLNAKGQTATMADNVASLISKVGTISNIKSIQRGSVSLSGTSITVNINPVNTANAIILLSIKPGGDFSYEFYKPAFVNGSSFTITSDFLGAACVIKWQVIEFNNVKSLQTGDTTISTANTAQTVTVNSVDPTKAILFAHVHGSNNMNADSGIMWNAELTNATTITLLSGFTNVKIAWQLIEFL